MAKGRATVWSVWLLLTGVWSLQFSGTPDCYEELCRPTIVETVQAFFVNLTHLHSGTFYAFLILPPLLLGFLAYGVAWLLPDGK